MVIALNVLKIQNHEVDVVLNDTAKNLTAKIKKIDNLGLVTVRYSSDLA